MATVLFLTAEGSTWWSNQTGRWLALPGATSDPVWVVTDLTEETLVEIAVPRIFGNDRTRFVQRQLTNRFPESPYGAALPPRRSGDLMSRLAPPQQVLMAIEPADRIKAALASLQNPVVGLWSMSVLLAQLGQAKALPATLLLVLGQASSTRIVFLKNRSPVLTRLVAGSTSAAEQAVEIVRTFRHLENTHVIERGTLRLPALLLGTHAGLGAALTNDRIDAVPSPVQRWTAHPNGWRDALFDLVCKSPPGQLAPLAMRSSYLAQQVQKAARIAMAVCLVAALAVASARVVSIMGDRGLQSGLNTTASQLAEQIARADASIESFGVSPELLRKVLALDTDEIDSAPDLNAQLVAISHAVGSVPSARVQSLNWVIRGPQETSCVSDVGAPTTAPAPSGEASFEPARKVELRLVIALAGDAGPRLQLQQATKLTDQFSAIESVLVVQDPARALRDGDITAAGSGQADAQRLLNWCLVLPGKPKAEAGSAVKP